MNGGTLEDVVSRGMVVVVEEKTESRAYAHKVTAFLEKISLLPSRRLVLLLACQNVATEAKELEMPIYSQDLRALPVFKFHSPQCPTEASKSCIYRCSHCCRRV